MKKFIKTKTLNNLSKTGRPKKLDTRNERALCKMVRRNPHITSSQLSTNLFNNKNLNICSSTVRRYLIKNNLLSYVSRRKPLLTNKMIKKRLAWSKKYMVEENSFWEKVLFSDECKIECFNTPAFSRVRRSSIDNPFKKEYLKPSVRFDQSVMVWGCFSANGTGMIELFDSTVNSKKNIWKLLKPKCYQAYTF